MRKFLKLGMFLLLAVLARGQDQTLADFLQEHKIPLPSDPHIHVNDRPAITLMPLETDDEFALAYRLAHADGGLYGPIQFIRYDKRTDRWTSLDVGLPESRFQNEMKVGCDGSVEGVERQHGWYFISVHLSPSAVCTIVLGKDRSGTFYVQTVLNGWMEGFMEPNIVLYSGSMVHFADVHPETLWMYDLDSNQLTQIYPQPQDPFRDDFSTKLEKIIDQSLCRERNWACEPDRFGSDIDSVVINHQTRAVAFHARFTNEGFMDRYPAEDSGLFDDEDYAYIFQLEPFRWREFSIFDLKPEFGTDSLQHLISPKMIGKVFATPAPD